MPAFWEPHDAAFWPSQRPSHAKTFNEAYWTTNGTPYDSTCESPHCPTVWATDEAPHEATLEPAKREAFKATIK